MKTTTSFLSDDGKLYATKEQAIAADLCWFINDDKIKKAGFDKRTSFRHRKASV